MWAGALDDPDLSFLLLLLCLWEKVCVCVRRLVCRDVGVEPLITMRETNKQSNTNKCDLPEAGIQVFKAPAAGNARVIYRSRD